eukprot:scaffold42866_cov35-Phaeocystis_antarctica.AAC.1
MTAQEELQLDDEVNSKTADRYTRQRAPAGPRVSVFRANAPRIAPSLTGLAAISQTTAHMHGHHEATMGLAGVSLGRELRALALSHTASVRRGTA